jgi:hypothetical protein
MGAFMQNWRVIDLAYAAVAALMVAMTGAPARAQDYCDTMDIMARTVNRDSAEKKVREKCKVGDIVFVDAGALLPRLCDFHQPVVRCGSSCQGGDQANYCLLAPPRKTY